MQNTTSYEPYNPQYSRPIINDGVLHDTGLSEITDAQREAAAERLRELIDTAQKEIREDS